MFDHSANNYIGRDLLPTVAVPGGKSLIGTNRPIFPMDGEGPARQMDIDPYLITSTTITNDQFEAFTVDTGYISEAEGFGWSFVFRDEVEDKTLIKSEVANLPWWCKIEGASWHQPKGPGSKIKDRGNVPVVHVSWNDALEFADWVGGRLPTEIEWEHAARGGSGDVLYPWGDAEPTPDNPRCHFGQIALDASHHGEIGPVSADEFESNGYGLYNFVGNVWEWTSVQVLQHVPQPPTMPAQYILKGGSYLCHPKHCYRYRIAARISNTPDSTLGHTGFRVVFDLNN